MIKDTSLTLNQRSASAGAQSSRVLGIASADELAAYFSALSTAAVKAQRSAAAERREASRTPELELLDPWRTAWLATSGRERAELLARLIYYITR